MVRKYIILGLFWTLVLGVILLAFMCEHTAPVFLASTCVALFCYFAKAGEIRVYEKQIKNLKLDVQEANVRLGELLKVTEILGSVSKDEMHEELKHIEPKETENKTTNE